MPGLPINPNASWPPPEWAVVFERFAEWSAWYSSDPANLAEVYAHRASVTHTRRKWWWQRVAEKPDTAGRAQLHVPVAADLAATSAALVFAEEPDVRIPEAHLTRAKPGAKKVEERLHEIVEEGAFYARLIEAAEVAGALGGVYLHPLWDRSLSSVPLLGITHPDSALPDYQYGLLRSVVFWTEELLDGTPLIPSLPEVQRAERATDDRVVLRHMEWHRRANFLETDGRACIELVTYKGRRDQVGEPIGEPQIIVLPFEDLDVQYVPGNLPNRLWRNLPIGMSVYAGSESVLDAIDETYAAWMRDVRLSKARIIAPFDYLSGGEFDVDLEAFTPLNMQPPLEETARSLMAQQFDIRADQFLKTILELVERTVNNAGFSPGTFGLRLEQRADSGIALRIRENKTSMNMLRRGHAWRTALPRVLRQMQLIDAAVLDGTDPRDFRPEVRLSDKIVDDPKELAETVQMLKVAQAASIEARVRIAQPNLREDEVAAEVARIKEEETEPTPPVVTRPGVPAGEPSEPPQTGAPSGDQ